MPYDPDRSRGDYPSGRSPWRYLGGILFALIILGIIWIYWSDANSPPMQPAATSEPAPTQR